MSGGHAIPRYPDLLHQRGPIWQLAWWLCAEVAYVGGMIREITNAGSIIVTLGRGSGLFMRQAPGGIGDGNISGGLYGTGEEGNVHSDLGFAAGIGDLENATDAPRCEVGNPVPRLIRGGWRLANAYTVSHDWCHRGGGDAMRRGMRTWHGRRSGGAWTVALAALVAVYITVARGRKREPTAQACDGRSLSRGVGRRGDGWKPRGTSAVGKRGLNGPRAAADADKGTAMRCVAWEADRVGRRRWPRPRSRKARARRRPHLRRLLIRVSGGGRKRGLSLRDPERGGGHTQQGSGHAHLRPDASPAVGGPAWKRPWSRRTASLVVTILCLLLSAQSVEVDPSARCWRQDDLDERYVKDGDIVTGFTDGAGLGWHNYRLGGEEGPDRRSEVARAADSVAGCSLHDRGTAGRGGGMLGGGRRHLRALRHGSSGGGFLVGAEVPYGGQCFGEPVRLYRSKRVCFGRRIVTEPADKAGVGHARLGSMSPRHGAGRPVPCLLAANVHHTVQLHFPCEEIQADLGCWWRIRRRLGTLAQEDTGLGRRRAAAVDDGLDDRGADGEGPDVFPDGEEGSHRCEYAAARTRDARLADTPSATNHTDQEADSRHTDLLYDIDLRYGDGRHERPFCFEMCHKDQWFGEPVRLYRSKRVCFGRRIVTEPAVMAGVGHARLSFVSPRHGADSSVPCLPAATVCHTVQLHFPSEEVLTDIGCWWRIRRRLGTVAREDPGLARVHTDADDGRVRDGDDDATALYGFASGGAGTHHVVDEAESARSLQAAEAFGAAAHGDRGGGGRVGMPHGSALGYVDGGGWRPIQLMQHHDGQRCGEPACLYRSKRVCFGRRIVAEPADKAGVGRARLSVESPHRGADSSVPRHSDADIRRPVQLHFPCDEVLADLGCWRRIRRCQGMSASDGPGLSVLDVEVMDGEAFGGGGRHLGSRPHADGGDALPLVADRRNRGSSGRQWQGAAGGELFRNGGSASPAKSWRSSTPSTSTPPAPDSTCSRQPYAAPSRTGTSCGRPSARAVSQVLRTRCAAVPRGLGDDDPAPPGGRAWPCSARTTGVAKGLTVPTCGGGASPPPVWVLLPLYVSHCFPFAHLFLLPHPSPWNVGGGCWVTTFADGGACSGGSVGLHLRGLQAWERRRCWSAWDKRRCLGQADNPGPAQVGPDIGEPARKLSLGPEGSVLHYPVPRGERSSMAVASPGFAAAAAAPCDKDRFQLVVETTNTTGWGQLKKRLEETSATVVLAQETWVLQAYVPAASAWARARGWRSVWAPAATTKKGGTSAGVAIFVRDFMGLHPKPGRAHIVHQSRVVAAILEAPGEREILLMSCYLKHGRKASGENARIRACIEDEVAAHGQDEVCVIGGDMNIEPQAMLATELDRNIGATLFYPSTPRGTYRTAKTASVLDYFFVTDRLAAAVEDVTTVEATGMKGHTPVHLRFKPRLAALRALHLRMPPKLCQERVVGPVPPPPDWAPQRALAEAALAAARARRACVEDVLESAYAAWADNAELELEGVTGVPLKKRGERACRPKVVWRSVLPEKRSKGAVFSLPAAAVWLRGIVVELQRIVGVAEEEAQRVSLGGHEGAAASMHRHDGEDADPPPDPVDDDVRRDGGGVPADDDADDDAAHGPPTTRERCALVIDGILTALEHDVPPGTMDDVFAEGLGKVRLLAHGIAGACGRGTREPAADGSNDPAIGAASSWTAGAAAEVADFSGATAAAREALDALVKTAEATAKSQDNARWRAWLSEDIDHGASRAHAYSRLPQEVVAAAAEVPGGGFSSAPMALLEEQRRKFCRLWRPAAGPYRYDWDASEELPCLTPAQLREASRSFKRRTAQTFDGFHPRHFSELADESLAVLAIILQAVEVSGQWPRQLRLVVTALLPKPKGGCRPIGILPAPYRLWAKARRPWADKWEAAHARGYLSSAKGNGPIDTLWRLGARQEAGTAAGEEAAVVADDLTAFFETVGREHLMREAVATSYPLPLLRGALATYSSARLLTMQGRVARETFPTVGVIAGCSLAMSLTKVFYLRGFDDLAAKLPRTVTMDVHVDDVTLSAVGPPNAIAADLAAARAELVVALGLLGCSIAPDKTAITATTRATAKEIARRVGASEAVTSTPCLLGVDNVAGARRARLGHKSKKAARLRGALARRLRLKHLHRAVGRKAARVFRAGLLPAASYDAAIWGMSQAEAVRLRRLAATTMSPRAPGRSLSMVTLWYGVPTADAEMAPVAHYSKMIWRAVVQRDEARMRGSSLADIRAWWEAARPHFEPLVKRACEARGDDGTIPHAVAKGLWRDVTGPISATALTLATVGWRFGSAYTLIDGKGVEYPLTSTSPALVKDLMRGALRASLERKIGHVFADRSEAFSGRRACLDIAIRASRPSKSITPHQSAVFRAVACGAIWTAQKAKERGYVCDGLCTLCKAEADTVHHRVYKCPHTREAVKRAVPLWFWREASSAPATAPFWTTAVVPHPGDLAAGPRDGMYCEVEYHDEQARRGTTSEERMEIRGRTYVDGSCKPSPIRELARAGCSLIVYGNGLQPSKTIRLPVPPHLPQTSQAAEYLAMATGFTYARGPSEVVGDCLAVARAFASASVRALAPVRKYGGLTLAAFRDAGPVKTVTARWTKAHRAPTGREDGDELRDIRGNEAADAAAKEAVELHPPLGTDLEAEVEFYDKRARHVVNAVTAAMQLYPPAPSSMERVARPRTLDEARRSQRHLWRYAAGAWRCAACSDYITSSSIPRYRLRQKCTGRGMEGSAAGFATLGHALVRTEGQLPVVACTKCGAWGNRRTRKLGQRCTVPTAAGVQATKRLAEGWHPALQLARDGRPKPRARTRIVAAYDAAAGAWRAVGGEGAAPQDAQTEDVGQHDDVDEGMPPCHDHHPHAGEVDALMELPLDYFVQEDGDSDYDVFGHGGAFDDPAGEPACGSAAAVERVTAGADAVDVPELVQPTSATAVGGVSSRRRQHGDRPTPVRDYVQEAVQRLGASLTRRDMDAGARLRRMRDRIRDKEAARGRRAPEGADADSLPGTDENQWGGDDRREQHCIDHGASGKRRRGTLGAGPPSGGRLADDEDGRDAVGSQDGEDQVEGVRGGARDLRRRLRPPADWRGSDRPDQHDVDGASPPPHLRDRGGPSGLPAAAAARVGWLSDDDKSDLNVGSVSRYAPRGADHPGPVGIGGASAPVPLAGHERMRVSSADGASVGPRQPCAGLLTADASAAGRHGLDFKDGGNDDAEVLPGGAHARRGQLRPRSSSASPPPAPTRRRTTENVGQSGARSRSVAAGAPAGLGAASRHGSDGCGDEVDTWLSEGAGRPGGALAAATGGFASRGALLARLRGQTVPAVCSATAVAGAAVSDRDPCAASTRAPPIAGLAARRVVQPASPTSERGSDAAASVGPVVKCAAASGAPCTVLLSVPAVAGAAVAACDGPPPIRRRLRGKQATPSASSTGEPPG